jgi:hypothetical protein
MEFLDVGIATKIVVWNDNGLDEFLIVSFMHRTNTQQEIIEIHGGNDNAKGANANA